MRAVISGIGHTGFSRSSGASVLELAAQAALVAIEDAGIATAEIDGIGTYHENDSVSPDTLATALGLGPLTWSMNWLQGGSATAAIVGHAGLAVSSDQAHHVLIYRAMNGASGRRMGDPGVGGLDDALQFTLPYGYGTPAQWYAMACRRHMHAYGTSAEVLGRIAVCQRRYANANPQAVMYGRAMTMDDYMESPLIAAPFRLLDCCQETDGAVALVVSRPGATGGVREVPIASATYASGPFSEPPYERYDDMTVMFPQWLRDRTFRDAGVEPADIDVVCLYDAFTFGVLCQLEDFGFFGKGEAASWILDGYGRERPYVNTNGGLLSEGYVHGLNNLLEAVLQLRGEAGPRQVAPARTALISGFGYARGSALVLVRR
ncbi:MAG: thiolase C-terminal domain-containing protein [Acidimicrobiales bacterium]